MERPDTRDFDAEIRSQVNDVLIPKYQKNMPFRLVDTYTGLIFEQSEIISLLKLRRDYRQKVDDAVAEAKRLAVPHGPPERPKRDHLDAFIAEFLAYAMFSHRWGDREPTLQDVRQADRGIYFMEDKDIVDVTPRALRMRRNETNDLPTGVEKLQEFCCLAAKCGYRWAWSDTCCINKADYAETSESINSMFLWYRSSDLTIVYLGDVDDVNGGRLPPLDDGQWFRDPEMRAPLPPSDPSVSPSSSDTYVEHFHTEKQYFSLHDRLRDLTYPQLHSMHPDTQVERPQLDDHLVDYFPDIEDHNASKGEYRKPPVWVTRGWTLQELVAPKRLRFYSKEWKLLEEAEDPDTEEAECKICISSFKRRARLVDHRTNDLWSDALERATTVPKEDLTIFEPGTRDVRSRLLWAARRTTTRVEDMAYCLLGVFDVSMPAIYGEGPRAFFRLQEELMKRTGDVSLFDWCGRSSSVNSFLAHDPRCFIEPGIPEPDLPPSGKSTLKMIIDLFCAILGTSLSGLEAAVLRFKDWVQNVMDSPPPGHTLVNGELNVSVFEHQVCKCTPLEVASSAGYCHYLIEGDGLEPTGVTLASNASSLVCQPTQYYLCRVWDRHTKNVFQVLLELIKYVLQDTWKEVLSAVQDRPECECPEPPAVVEVENDSQVRLRDAMETKRRQVMHFFKDGFPVYLVRVEEDRRVRVNTVNRVVVEYSRKRDFTKPLVTRMIL